jgi:deoxyribonuclease (pyrimidine dimer)
MTRINCGIPPAELNNKMLFAEYREIKRIPNLITKGKFSLNGQPKKFKLGTGHCKFFYDKCGYLLKRFKLLRQECLNRKINITDYESAWDGVPGHLMNDYKPTEDDKQIVRERIKERLQTSKNNVNETIC